MRHASIRNFALCDSLPEPIVRLRYLKMVGILPEDAESVPVEVESRLDLAIAGVNHLTWLLRFTYDGEDQLPKVRAHLAENAALERAEEEAKDAGTGGRTDDNTYSKRKFNAVYSLELMDIYGAAPAVIGHTKEYVPFYQGLGTLPDDAFLELRCDLDMHGPRPQPVGDMPRGIRALQEQTLDTHAP